MLVRATVVLAAVGGRNKSNETSSKSGCSLPFWPSEFYAQHLYLISVIFAAILCFVDCLRSLFSLWHQHLADFSGSLANIS